MDWFFKKTDWYLVGAVSFLFLLSLTILYSLSITNSQNKIWLYRQALWIFLGAILFFVFSMIDYRIFMSRSVIWFLYLFSVVLLVGVLFWGTTISGNRAWFSINGFTLQPVEFVKIVLVLFLARYFSEKNIEIWRFRHIVISFGFLVGVAGLVLLQPDVGSVVVLIGIWFFMLILSGARTGQVLLLILFFIILFGVGWQWFFSENQKARVLSFLTPHKDPFGVAYSQNQALVAIGSGGLWGKGLGKGSQVQFGFLPASRTDFIFAAIAEELGFVGVFFVIIAFAVLCWRLVSVALWGSNNFIRLFSLGFLTTIFIHLVINLGMNLGFLPVIGIGLPFVSYGGSSILALAISLGIINSIKLRM